MLRDCTNGKLPVYNSAMLSKPPKEIERIEFRLDHFISTGQIYANEDKFGDAFKSGTVSEYRCQLIIRVFDDPKNCSVITSAIAGAIQTFAYTEQFARQLYLLNETMRIKPFSIQRDNKILNFTEMVIKCYLPLEWKADIDYFTRLEDTVFDIHSVPKIKITRK